MKTKINFSLLLTGLIGLTSLNAEAQSSKVWARVTDAQAIPTVLQNGEITSSNAAFANSLNQLGVNGISQALPSSRNTELLNVYEFNCQCEETELNETLKNFPGVIGQIERAPEYHTLYVPNDYSASFQSNYALDLIKATQAWNLAQSNANIVIGISDENLDPNHEELAGKLAYYDIHNAHPTEHGTAVAILAGGNTNNMVGMSSIGFNSSLAFYQMSFNQLLAATYSGIDVINVSWFSGCTPSSFEQAVIDEVYSNGTFIVAAAGNGTTCGDASSMAYPASYNHVFSVTSIGDHDTHEENPGDPNSTHQHNSMVDLSAPGYNVNISDAPDHYITGTGTSYAAPFVSGTVALMLSVNPCLDNYEIEQILKNSANNIEALNPSYIGQIGAGRLNANAAVSMALALPNNMDVVTTAVSGCSEGTGVISVSPTNGQEPYTASWSNSMTGFSNEGLNSGSYTITVTDAHGCIVTSTANILNESPIIESTATTNVTCNGSANGAISIVMAGGNPSYGYTWSNGAVTQNQSNLPAGTYDVSITNSNGCSTEASFTITEPSAISATTTISNDLGNNEGAIDLSVVGGASGYTFEWSNGATTEDISGLSAGYYEVNVTDANGCSTSVGVDVLDESAAGINTNEYLKLIVFPNPSSGSVTISYRGNATEITVLDQNARIVLWKPLEIFQDINVEGLESGLYSVRLTGSTGKIVSKKLVVL